MPNSWENKTEKPEKSPESQTPSPDKVEANDSDHGSSPEEIENHFESPEAAKEAGEKKDEASESDEDIDDAFDQPDEAGKESAEMSEQPDQDPQEDIDHAFEKNGDSNPDTKTDQFSENKTESEEPVSDEAFEEEPEAEQSDEKQGDSTSETEKGFEAENSESENKNAEQNNEVQKQLDDLTEEKEQLREEKNETADAENKQDSREEQDAENQDIQNRAEKLKEELKDLPESEQKHEQEKTIEDLSEEPSEKTSDEKAEYSQGNPEVNPEDKSEGHQEIPEVNPEEESEDNQEIPEVNPEEESEDNQEIPEVNPEDKSEDNQDIPEVNPEEESEGDQENPELNPEEETEEVPEDSQENPEENPEEESEEVPEGNQETPEENPEEESEEVPEGNQETPEENPEEESEEVPEGNQETPEENPEEESEEVPEGNQETPEENPEEESEEVPEHSQENPEENPEEESEEVPEHSQENPEENPEEESEEESEEVPEHSQENPEENPEEESEEESEEVPEGSQENPEENPEEESEEVPEDSQENPEENPEEESEEVPEDSQENPEENPEEESEENPGEESEDNQEIPEEESEEEPEENQESPEENPEEEPEDHQENPEENPEEKPEETTTSPEEKTEKETEDEKRRPRRMILKPEGNAESENSEKEKKETEESSETAKKPSEEAEDKEEKPSEADDEDLEDTPEEEYEENQEEEPPSEPEQMTQEQPEEPVEESQEPQEQTPSPAGTGEKRQPERRKKTEEKEEEEDVQPSSHPENHGGGSPVMTSTLENTAPVQDPVPLAETRVESPEKRDEGSEETEQDDQSESENTSGDDDQAQGGNAANDPADPNSANFDPNANSAVLNQVSLNGVDPVFQSGSVPISGNTANGQPGINSFPMDQQEAFRALQVYMNAHNYGPEDFEKYQQDPEWQKLHRAAFPEWHRQRALDALKGQIESENGGLIPLPVPLSEREKGIHTDRAGMLPADQIGFQQGFGPDTPDFWEYKERNNGHTKSDYLEMASHIPEVWDRLRSGESLDQLLKDPKLGACASQYFSPENMIRVERHEDGSLEFSTGGRHRIAAAQELGLPIPVQINEYADKHGYPITAWEKQERYNALMDYMRKHNYGENDRFRYEKDEEWQRLHEAYMHPVTEHQKIPLDWEKEADAALRTDHPEWVEPGSERVEQSEPKPNSIRTEIKDALLPGQRRVHAYSTKADMARQNMTSELILERIKAGELVDSDTIDQIQIAVRYQDKGLESREHLDAIRECGEIHKDMGNNRILLKDMPELAENRTPEQNEILEGCRASYQARMKDMTEVLIRQGMPREVIEQKINQAAQMTPRQLREASGRLCTAAWDYQSRVEADARRNCAANSAEYILRNGESWDVKGRYAEINRRNVACMLALQEFKGTDEQLEQACIKLSEDWNKGEYQELKTGFSPEDVRQIRQGIGVLREIRDRQRAAEGDTRPFSADKIEHTEGSDERVQAIDDQIHMMRYMLSKRGVTGGPWLEKQLAAKRESLIKEMKQQDLDNGGDALTVPYVSMCRYCDETKAAFDQHCVEKTNPDYEEDTEFPFYNNCQRTAIAYVLNLKGEEVEAAPRPKGGGYDELASYSGVFNAWEGAVEVPIPIDEDDDTSIEAQMDQWGEGAVAEVVVIWKSDKNPPVYSGHVFIARQINGRTEYIDPQNPDRPSDMMKDSLRSKVMKGCTKICRVDHLKFKEEYRSTVLKKD